MKDKDVTLTIDGLPITVNEGMTILEAARKVNIKIPTLCDHPDLCRRAVCRICVVENHGHGKLLASCVQNAEEGMSIVTNNSRLFGIRKTILSLILANHPHDDCLACIRSTKCELQSLAELFCIREPTFHIRESTFHNRESVFEENSASEEAGSLKEISCGALVRDMEKCVKCGRCVDACQEIQTIRAINTSGRSGDYGICTPYTQPLSESLCVFCGHCAEVCPVGAIYEHDQSGEVWTLLSKETQDMVTDVTPLDHGFDYEGGKAFLSEKKHDMVIQIAPHAAGDVCAELGLQEGAATIGKIITALKQMGFSGVYNAESFEAMSADEEADELNERVKSSRHLPMISGCSAGCAKFVKEFYPDLAEHLSKAKSPEQNFREFIEKNGSQAPKGAEKVFVTVAPCIAKKYMPTSAKTSRVEEIVLSTRELARLIQMSGIDLCAVDESAFDKPSADACGAKAKGKEQDKLLEVHGFANARKVLDSIRSGECGASHVKIMSCPSGCNS